jgi:hypothetical protein
MTQRTLKADLSPDQPTTPPTKGLTQLDKERAESMADGAGPRRGHRESRARVIRRGRLPPGRKQRLDAEEALRSKGGRQ